MTRVGGTGHGHGPRFIGMREMENMYYAVVRTATAVPGNIAIPLVGGVISNAAPIPVLTSSASTIVLAIPGRIREDAIDKPVNVSMSLKIAVFRAVMYAMAAAASIENMGVGSKDVLIRSGQIKIAMSLPDGIVILRAVRVNT
jgi:hypothetical protein